jgi:predicted DCC family thiol-disulfide oxidoreductase YuxK
MYANGTHGKKIVLFDGVCNLCNGTVVFIIQRDTKDRFRFAALQSDIGIQLTQELGIDTTQIESIIVVHHQRYYYKSGAALRIARDLKGAWPLLSVFLIIPPFIRDGIYDIIARNRYRWFGKKESCMIPTPELKSKFL